MFVNFSNHPSKTWNNDQREAAGAYGSIVDVAFPNVSPNMDEDGVLSLARDCYDEIMRYSPAAVMCQGEFTLSYSVINMLKSAGVSVLAACTERVVKNFGDTRFSEFKFIQFREYG